MPRRPRARRRKHRLWALGLSLPLLCLLLLLAVEWQLAPLIQVEAAQTTQSRALVAVNGAVRDVVTEYAGQCSYRTLMTVERDASGRVTLLMPDTLLLDQIAAEVALRAEHYLTDLSQTAFTLPLGSVTGSSLFAALGPDLPFRCRASGTPQVRVADDLDSAGINQVRHRIYLVVDCQIQVLVPFSSQTTEVQATVLLAEGLIVGYTPDTYINIQGGDELAGALNGGTGAGR